MSTTITFKADSTGYIHFTNGGKQRIDTLHQFIMESVAAAIVDNFTDTSFDLNWDHGKYVEACQAVRIKPMRSWKDVLTNLGIMPDAKHFTERTSGSTADIPDDAYDVAPDTGGNKWFGLGRGRKAKPMKKKVATTDEHEQSS